eukprot:scaffold17319_cov169-Skeletonema_dohrnii-CCMP3373.AAC.2
MMVWKTGTDRRTLVILVKDDEMFHHVVLANDDEESVADNETPLCVSARSNLGARLDDEKNA